MYNKLKAKGGGIYHHHHFDRDSGIVTESESDIDLVPASKANYIFSDDDDDLQQQQQQQQHIHNLGDIYNIPTLSATATQHNYMNIADQSVVSIRHYLKSLDWKKVLKHKSGTTVYMLQNTAEKTALFRGEAIIHGFTPQSIFYVIGMRKLWDENFDEGSLIENLNDTTSLTYESYKSTTTSKAYDLTLVEKIECSADGEILFACTSIDTPQIPKTPGKNRHHIKLQGWILRQINTTPVSTHVTYITQENIKGWIPGLTKKSLARKPLVIASIDGYLRKKADRLRQQQPQQQQQQKPITININSASTSSFASSSSNYNHSNNSFSTNKLSPSSILQQQHDSLETPPRSPLEKRKNDNNDNNHKNNRIILSNPPPRISSLSSTTTTTTTKHITFADDNNNTSRSSSPSDYTSGSTSSSARSSYDKENTSSSSSFSPSPSPLSLNTNHLPLSPITEMSPSPFSSSYSGGATKKRAITTTTTAIAGSKLYPASRHRTARKTCIDQLKAYASSDVSSSDWKLMSEEHQDTKVYTQTKTNSTLPVIRSETIFHGTWTPEQICSVVQCFGARKIWDEHFQDGNVVERFSQKEYLIYTQMKSIFPIQSRDFSLLTCIESNVSTGTIYIASTSVHDDLIPEKQNHIRGSFTIYGWVLEPLKEEGSGVKATCITHLDMGGTSPLPSAICRLLSSPTTIDKIQLYLDQHGCPPYIRRVAGKITLESFHHQQYTIQYIAKHAPSTATRSHRNSIQLLQSMWCTDIRIHSSMYPTGYSVITRGEVRVELRPDKLGIRIYTENQDMDGKNVLVEINNQQHDGANAYSWNNQPLYTEQEVLQQQKQQKKQEAIIKKKKSILVTSQKQVLIDDDASSKTNVVKQEKQQQQQQQQLQLQQHHHERRNSHVIVLSDELSFTGPQFSFILLMMAICYYLGKFSCHCT